MYWHPAMRNVWATFIFMLFENSSRMVILSLITDDTKCEIGQVSGHLVIVNKLRKRNFIAASLVNVLEECGNNSAFAETIIEMGTIKTRKYLNDAVTYFRIQRGFHYALIIFIMFEIKIINTNLHNDGL